MVVLMEKFVSVSGGLDSTALAIITSKVDKDAKYIFADTGDEFPQVYDHLAKMESVLGIEIIRVKREQTLGEYEVSSKYFPSPMARFCTRMFKIEPIQRYCKEHEPYTMAIGIRADENRKGGTGDECVYPLQEYGFAKCDVLTICQEHDLVPKYPWYMSRGGCYSCFYKSKNELLGLAKYEPDLFDKLVEREESIQDSRKKYYHMFESIKLPARRIKEIANEMEQVEMFSKDGLNTYQDCGEFCRK